MFILLRPKMEEQEKDIIHGALGMFNKFGLRSVTMDDVARELGISKKTIYKYFENKADLIQKSVQTVHDAIEETLMAIHNKSTNPIDELVEIDSVVCEIMKRHNPSLRYQLQKYYPRTYNYLYEGRHKLIHKMIRENIEMGQKGGWYREDASKEVISFLYCAKVETIPEEEEEIFASFEMPFIMNQALIYHIRGLATAKGLEYLETKLKDIKTEK